MGNKTKIVGNPEIFGGNRWWELVVRFGLKNKGRDDSTLNKAIEATPEGRRTSSFCHAQQAGLAEPL